ncbi:hypothetical protein ZMO02_11150 [Zymomonas mobilis subsp. pomaceae]|nr:hypothetical protein ZMO02_11150 [Zymomonas mobilis subsp. pomaceae]
MIKRLTIFPIVRAIPIIKVPLNKPAKLPDARIKIPKMHPRSVKTIENFREVRLINKDASGVRRPKHKIGILVSNPAVAALR